MGNVLRELRAGGGVDGIGGSKGFQSWPSKMGAGKGRWEATVVVRTETRYTSKHDDNKDSGSGTGQTVDLETSLNPPPESIPNGLRLKSRLFVSDPPFPGLNDQKVL